MDLTIRDWMVIIGALLILAVLIDAVRRMRSDRYSRVKVKLVDPQASTGADTTQRDEELNWLKELPNGGARVVQRDDLVEAAVQHREQERASPAASDSEAPEELDEDVELLSGVSTDRDRDDGLDTGNIDWLDEMSSEASLDASVPAVEEPPGPGRLPREISTEVFMLNVVARDQSGFRGEDILHILLACDLRFGDMSFFHRHEFEAGRGAIQFSVANMMQPGVFDIDQMADFNTPGLVFFVTLPGPEDMMKAFDYMLETAQAVARNLGGDVLDETRSALTAQTLEHARQKIRDLERRLLATAR
ncbi:MAG: cell division protein ZipA [Pseudomonadota bacterium]